MDGIATSNYTIAVFSQTTVLFPLQTYIIAGNSRGGDWFENSVAISNNTLAVGAAKGGYRRGLYLAIIMLAL
jgi:hypothetical protein